MVIMAQQSYRKGLPEPVENSRMSGFVALLCTAGNQKHATQDAPAKTDATRIASTLSFHSVLHYSLGQIEMVKSGSNALARHN